MNITPEQLQQILEAALMVAGRPLTIANMQKLFDEAEEPEANVIKAALNALRERYDASSGVEIREVASGYQFQAKTNLSQWLCRLWEERPPRYSRAVLETLALIAYRQPITRAEIEEIRGVAVSSHIIKALQEREWVRVIGYREVVGKPALYGTTKAFLDHFNLKTLDELPTLAEIKDLDTQEAKLQVQLELPEPRYMGEETAELAREQEIAEGTSELAQEQEVAEETSELAHEQEVAEKASELAQEQEIAEETSELVQEQEVAEETSELAQEQEVTEQTSEFAQEQEVAEETSEFGQEQETAEEIPALEETYKIEEMLEQTSELSEPILNAEGISEEAELPNE